MVILPSPPFIPEAMRGHPHIIIGVFHLRGVGASVGVLHMLPGHGVRHGLGVMTHIGLGDLPTAGVGDLRGAIILLVRAGDLHSLRVVPHMVTTVPIRVQQDPHRLMPVGLQIPVPVECITAQDVPLRLAGPVLPRLQDPPTALLFQDIRVAGIEA